MSDSVEALLNQVQRGPGSNPHECGWDNCRVGDAPWHQHRCTVKRCNGTWLHGAADCPSGDRTYERCPHHRRAALPVDYHSSRLLRCVQDHPATPILGRLYTGALRYCSWKDYYREQVDIYIATHHIHLCYFHEQELLDIRDGILKQDRFVPYCLDCSSIIHSNAQSRSDFVDIRILLQQLPYRQNQGFYTDYLDSSQWQDIRRRVIARAKDSCERCGATANRKRPLDVHHLTYDRLGHERLSDLVAHCRQCHEHVHGRQFDTESPSKRRGSHSS
jgi:hypothetical protein